MDDNLFLIIMAFVAGFIILQLRRTLGRKGGYDGKDEKQSDNVVPINGRINQDDDKEEEQAEAREIGLPKSSPFYDALEKVNSFDHSFNLPSFIDGAEYAYGMILNAFWQGDIKTLRSFLSRDVFKQFENAINEMKEKGHEFHNKVDDIEKIELKDASIEGSMAELTLRYKSHMTIVIKDADGNVVDGDPEKVVPVVDIWTFCRDVKRGDPNWTLVSTSNA